MKIGFVGNFWGTPKGHSYVTRDMVNILKDANNEIFMYRIGKKFKNNLLLAIECHSIIWESESNFAFGVKPMFNIIDGHANFCDADTTNKFTRCIM